MKTDVIIVGSGLLGAVCARRLAENGLSILILEAGEAISSPAGEHLRNQTYYQDNPDKFLNEITKWCHHFDAKAAPEHLPGANVTHAIGGQSILWTNNCPRPQLHERWSALSNEEWDKYLTQAEDYLFVNDNLFDHSVRQKNIINTLSNHLARQQRIIGKNPTAAKRSSNGNIQFTAMKEILDIPKNISQEIHIQSNSIVLELIHQGNQITGLIINHDGKVVTLVADQIIIAAGAFDTTQLLYNSHIHSPALGKYLHFHPLYFGQLVLNEELCVTDDKTDVPPRTCIYPTLSYPWHIMVLRDLFIDKQEEITPENRLCELQCFIPTDIIESNRMILSHSTPTFEITLTDNDKKNIVNAKQDLLDLSKLLGHFRKNCEPFLMDFGFTHPMGMCRMGDDPNTSVANWMGKVHGFANLYLASVGLIPKSIAVNPSLTAAALAIASCDFLIKN